MIENYENRTSVAMIANNLDINGISTVIMNYCTHINLKNYEICIIVGGNVAECHRYICNKLGIELIELPNRKKESLKYFLELDKTLRKKRFDIIHVHGNQSSIAIELLIGWKNGIKLRIAHSHNTMCMSVKLHKVLKPVFNAVYTDGFACGEDAGKWLFGKRNYNVIPNGFDTEKFRYSEALRDSVREELGIKDKLVIGHVGGFNDQKNQEFLLKIFEEIAKENQDVVLLMVGTGPKEVEIKELLKVHPFNNRVLMCGQISTPEKMYSAMDAFVFPSKYEGLPVALLEAQINGLNCVISDTITRESIIGDRVKTVSLNESPNVWAKSVTFTDCKSRSQFYEHNRKMIDKYNIDNTSNILIDLYQNMINKHG